MRYEQRPTSSLTPYENNARTHSEAQVDEIAASIQAFGFCNPILISGDGMVIAGHGRLMAAEQLGLEQVPVVVLDHLDETQRRALILADNRIALNAGWDDELLRRELSALQVEGVDLQLTGFNAAEIKLHTAIPDFKPVIAEERLDERTPTRCPQCGHEFTP